MFALVEDDRAQNIMQINASSGEVKAFTSEMAVYNALDINENVTIVTLYGNTATPNEIYIASNNNNFQKLFEKDLIVICDVGAYGMSLSSNYNVRPKPIEILIKNSKIKVINKRQKLTDII